MSAKISLLHPVVMDITREVSGLDTTEKEKVRSLAARKALARSARLSGLTLSTLKKDDQGTPIPANGVYWSLSHTDHYVAGLSGLLRVGIDIEEIVPFSQILVEQIADQDEWALVDSIEEHTFYRYWTAKEAVLKAVGVGLQGLPKCRINEILDASRMILSFGTESWIVQNSNCVPGHVVSVASLDVDIKWHFMD